MSAAIARARALKIPEKDLQANVETLAGHLGWKVFHDRDSRKNDPGWPDCVMTHPSGRLLVAELKSAKGRLTECQIDWLIAFILVGAEVRVFTVYDWLDGSIEAALR